MYSVHIIAHIHWPIQDFGILHGLPMMSLERNPGLDADALGFNLHPKYLATSESGK